MLGKQLSILKEISKTIPAIITSQVYSNMENSSNLLARETIKKYSDKIIKLEKNPRNMIIENTKKQQDLR